MKLKLISLIAASVAFLGGQTSFAQLKTDTVKESGTYRYSDSSKYNYKFSISLEYAVSGITKTAVNKINQGISDSVFGIQYDGDIKGMVEAYRDLCVRDFKEENVESDWALTEKGSFGETYGNKRSYIFTSTIECGNPNPVVSKTAVVFDTRTGALLTEREILLPGYEITLPGLIAKHKFDTRKDINYFPDAIWTSNNFYVTSKGITFVYNPFDVAPSSEGIIEITVPWQELKPIMDK